MQTDDFTVIFVCVDDKTKEIKYLNKEYSNEKGYYPQNTKEDIDELISSLGYDEDLELYDLSVIDVCEVLDGNGNCLWSEEDNVKT